ncbi:Transcription factor [Penicillium griseofulvum]|uniref:Transcription factor n=1 Tax=Penicillium patulum TaxID=5078 RepID=A0A135LSJ4_PENPA|nr:Transcription factor [Penicillium griseofulvum]KXG51937.1 Transcription factor [Penicillium griseofulvum]
MKPLGASEVESIPPEPVRHVDSDELNVMEFDRLALAALTVAFNAIMLRNRIELLERALQTHGIDPDTAIQQMSKTENPEPDTDCAPACSNVVDLCPTFDGALTLDESLNFDQDGEVRYFGPTNLPNEESYQSDDPSIQTGETPWNESTDSLEESFIPDALRSHLIDLYFEWEQPWFQMVNEKLFRESMICGGRYFSPLLLNCILALGSRYCDRIEVRSDPNDSNTAGKIFLDQAEKLLQNDLKWPKITTIQSLAIMGMAYIAMGSDAAGWLHQGMANRLALDMGFNMDPSVLSGAVALPAIEIELRRQIYWALYCHDKLSASYTGRVCTLLDSQGVVKKPFPLCASDVYLPSANGNGQLRAASQRDVVQLHRAMIDLCRIFEKVLLSFWSPKPLLQPNQRSAFFDSCVLELKTWYYDLAPELKVDRPSGPSRSPHTYTLCMLYHTVCVLLCVPFLNNHPTDRQKQQNNNQGPEPPADKQKFITVCGNSARGMCVVAQKYRQTFGSFKRSPITTTHAMLSAAIIIIENCCLNPTAKSSTGTQAPRGRPSPQAAVGLCLQVLRELSTSWNIAKRIGRNLEKLYCQRLNCDVDHMPPAPSLECNDSCAIPCQPPDTDVYLGPMAATELSRGLLNPQDPYAQNTVLAPPLPTINWFDVPTSNSPQQYDNGGMIGFGATPNPDEVFINNLGFAFSANCLPSDYNMFDTLNQMYLEDIW